MRCVDNGIAMTISSASILVPDKASTLPYSLLLVKRETIRELGSQFAFSYWTCKKVLHVGDGREEKG
jgi:hypothetical protein